MTIWSFNLQTYFPSCGTSITVLSLVRRSFSEGGLFVVCFLFEAVTHRAPPNSFLLSQFLLSALRRCGGGNIGAVFGANACKGEPPSESSSEYMPRIAAHE